MFFVILDIVLGDLVRRYVLLVVVRRELHCLLRLARDSLSQVPQAIAWALAFLLLFKIARTPDLLTVILHNLYHSLSLGEVTSLSCEVSGRRQVAAVVLLIDGHGLVLITAPATDPANAATATQLLKKPVAHFVLTDQVQMLLQIFAPQLHRRRATSCALWISFATGLVLLEALPDVGEHGALLVMNLLDVLVIGLLHALADHQSLLVDLSAQFLQVRLGRPHLWRHLWHLLLLWHRCAAVLLIPELRLWLLRLLRQQQQWLLLLLRLQLWRPIPVHLCTLSHLGLRRYRRNPLDSRLLNGISN